jgi:NAD(P)H-flavin reductase
MTTLTLTARHEDAVDLVHLVFDAPVPGHDHAGQYVVLTLPEGARGTFALANRPGEPAELLVKRGGEAADALAALPFGAAVSVDAARGPGWGVPDGASPVVLLVNGSGLAAVRPLIHELLASPAPRPLHLFFGAISDAHVPFRADLDAWASAGVDVRYVWDHAPVRFVQLAAVEAGLLRPPAVLVLCGHGPMLAHAKQLWAEAGGAPELARVNF